MGYNVNPSNKGFARSLRSQIYVDKSGLIAYTNKVLDTNQKYVCVSRPRRFGKTMTAEMLTAYYSRGCYSGNMFANLNIASDPSYKIHLNQYNVIFLNIQRFLSKLKKVEELTAKIAEKVIKEIKGSYSPQDVLTDILDDIYAEQDIPFVFVIDEWDCIFREYKEDKITQKRYLDFLRDLLKDREYAALTYMTGILPIKKYGSHSALNMFDEFSMSDPGPLEEFVGFTQDEVNILCAKYNMSIEDMAQWYNGYHFRMIKSVYNPKSVVTAILRGYFGNYWTKTETYEALSFYIDANFDGLRDAVIELLAGEKKCVDVSGFTNDMVTFKNYDDILTLLIHLGYLGYDVEKQEVFIPNKEISDEFVTAVKNEGWGEIAAALKASDDLLKATWRADSQSVAAAIEKAHNDISIIRYNDENALSCVISLAYYSARQYYTIVREMPAGKGFADLVFIPRKSHLDKPAMILELKWDLSVIAAIQQIKDRQYTEILKGYKDNALLIGITYDKVSKRHECTIERFTECIDRR